MCINMSELLTAEYDGIRYTLDCPVFKYHIERGISEPYPNHIRVVRKYLSLFPHKNRICIDVGGHIGTTALPYSRLFEHVYAYEPTSRNYRFLEENVRNNGASNITCINKGIYSEDCRGSILLHGSNSGCYYFSKQDNGSIECTTLDKGMYTRVDFLKIDVEGAELFALQGALQTIRTWKPLIHLEINGLSERNYGISESKIFEMMKSLGYLVFERPDPNNYFFYCPNDSLNIVPRVIYTFWTDTNPMSENRKQCLQQLYDTTGCQVKLITPETLGQYILPEFPLHPAYPYLSQTHKADYLRTYFMHFYGGGYTDMKRTEGCWESAFTDILQHVDYIANGYREPTPECIAYDPYKPYYKDLIGNCSYIIRPNTEFTREWYSSMLQVLDRHLPELQTHPARHPRDKKEEGTGYPIEWNEMLGRIFHRLLYSYKDRLLYSLPASICKDYI